MQTRTIGALALVAAVGAAAPAAAEDAKAQEILAKARKAIGGSKIETLKSLSLESAVQRNAGSFQIQNDNEILIEFPDKYVRNTVMSGPMSVTTNTGFNGERAILPPNISMLPGGGMVFRMGGPAGAEGEKPTPEQLAQINARTLRSQREEISRLMLGWLAMAHPSLPVEYTYAGEAESPDGKAHVIDVKDADGFSARLFIDQNNHLPLMVSYQGRQPRVMTSGAMSGRRTTAAAAPPGQGRQLTEEERKKLQEDPQKQVAQMMAQESPMVEFSLFFDDWREVDGLVFPHVVRRAVGGTTDEEWTISKVKVNPRIDAKKFAVPEPK